MLVTSDPEAGKSEKRRKRRRRRRSGK